MAACPQAGLFFLTQFLCPSLVTAQVCWPRQRVAVPYLLLPLTLSLAPRSSEVGDAAAACVGLSFTGNFGRPRGGRGSSQSWDGSPALSGARLWAGCEN